MTRKMKNVELDIIELFEFEDKPLEEVIEFFQNVLNIKSKLGFCDLTLTREMGYYGDPDYFQLRAKRPETDKEMKARIRKNEQAKIAREVRKSKEKAKRKARYEELKREFEGCEELSET